MEDRRSQLLDGATAWVLDNGLSSLSLRPLAATLETSDRMLLYYFETKEQLVGAISDHAGEGLAAALPTIDEDDPGTARDWLQACWALFTDPAVRPAMALLFELDAAGVRAPGAERSAAQRVAQEWSELVDTALGALGAVPPSRAALGRLIAAALVGLALDALVQDRSPDPPKEVFDILAQLIESEVGR